MGDGFGEGKARGRAPMRGDYESPGDPGESSKSER